jgi:dephospho-CoA kinase
VVLLHRGRLANESITVCSGIINYKLTHSASTDYRVARKHMEFDRVNLLQITKRQAVGLTGGIATGKSHIAKILAQKGYTVIDADQLSREVVAQGTTGLAKLTDTFGGIILDEQGCLNRRLLREKLSSSPDFKLKLESIMHPLIYGELEKKVNQLITPATLKPWFYEASLLVEVGRHKDFLELWVCHCPESVQLERLQKRDHHTIEEAKRIVAAQMPQSDKLLVADFVLQTSDAERALSEKIDQRLAGLSIF